MLTVHNGAPGIGKYLYFHLTNIGRLFLAGGLSGIKPGQGQVPLYTTLSPRGSGTIQFKLYLCSAYNLIQIHDGDT